MRGTGGLGIEGLVHGEKIGDGIRRQVEENAKLGGGDTWGEH